MYIYCVMLYNEPNGFEKVRLYGCLFQGNILILYKEMYYLSF